MKLELIMNIRTMSFTSLTSLVCGHFCSFAQYHVFYSLRKLNGKFSYSSVQERSTLTGDTLYEICCLQHLGVKVQRLFCETNFV